MAYTLLKIADVKISNDLYNFSFITKEGFHISFYNIKLKYIVDNQIEFIFNQENKNYKTLFTFIIENNKLIYISKFYYNSIDKEDSYINSLNFLFDEQNIVKFFNDIKMSYNRYSRY